MSYVCRNHPYVETNALCAQCAQPFCDACTVELLGQRYCAPCRDMRVVAMQGQVAGRPMGAAPLAGTGIVDIGRWLSGGWAILQGNLLSFAVAMLVGGFLGLFTCGILAGPVQAGLLMM